METYSFPDNVMAKGVLALPDGGAAIVGDGTILNSGNATSILFYKLAGLMIEDPPISFTGGYSDEPDGSHSLVQTKDGGFLIAGYSTQKRSFDTNRAGYLIKIK